MRGFGTYSSVSLCLCVRSSLLTEESYAHRATETQRHRKATLGASVPRWFVMVRLDGPVRGFPAGSAVVGYVGRVPRRADPPEQVPGT